LRQALLDAELLRLNLGIFALHAIQMAMFVVVPTLIVAAGLPVSAHWQLYLPVVLGSFVLMLLPVLHADRRNAARGVMLGSIALLVAVLGAFAAAGAGLMVLALLLLAFFAAFNVLEALIPSLVSRLAPEHARGAAIGVYNTAQTLGLFFGGLAGGWVAERYGPVAVFGACTLLALAWLGAAVGMRPVNRMGGESFTMHTVKER
jgi:MFS family permease